MSYKARKTGKRTWKQVYARHLPRERKRKLQSYPTHHRPALDLDHIRRVEAELHTFDPFDHGVARCTYIFLTICPITSRLIFYLQILIHFMNNSCSALYDEGR